MSYVERKIGNMMVRSPAHWLPIQWYHWDDYNARPAEVPEFLWVAHHGHQAAIRQSAFGVHAFHCSDCDVDWTEASAP